MICNEDLAQLLYLEVLPLYACTRPLLKKKACILSYKIILNNPESAEKIAPYLADRLRDPHLSVQIAAITTIMQLTRLFPNLFKECIPTVYDLLLEQTQGQMTNWLTIKLIKLMSIYLTVEPRLEKKLEPLFIKLL
jgi:AP-3 complex subunit delta